MPYPNFYGIANYGVDSYGTNLLFADLLLDCGSGLTSITQDVLSAGNIKAFWGNITCDPLTRVADVGTLDFTLNNSTSNSARTMGYYSPSNGSVRVGFSLMAPVVLKWYYNGVFHYKRFYITSIDPAPGIYGKRSTTVSCSDYMGRFAVQNTTNIAVQVSQRTDQALATLVNMMPICPLLTSYQASPDTTPYLLDDITTTTAYTTALQHLAQTDVSYIFAAGDATVGETLSHQTRQYRQTQASALTISTDLNETHVPMSERFILNDVTVNTFPATIGTVNEQLYLSAQELTIQPNVPVTLQCRFTDPMTAYGSPTQIRIVPLSGVTPVAGTDYKASFTSGNETLQDANTSLSIVITWYASYAVAVLTNLSNKTLFVNPFGLRGKTIRLYNQNDIRVQDSAANIGKYGTHALAYQMYYQSDPNVGNDCAGYFLSKWKTPVSVSEYHEYIANRNATLSAGAVALDIGRRYTAAETVTGINQDFNIMGIELTITAAKPGNPLIKVRYYPEPTALAPQFLLDDATYGVLDTGPGLLAF